MKNILESFLDALEVRYTKRYVRRLYEEHPHRGNMYGLKQMLAVYGVRALGVYIHACFLWLTAERNFCGFFRKTLAISVRVCYNTNI